MKRFLRVMTIAAVALFGLQSCEKEDNYINASLLPTEAQNFLSAHYSSVEVQSVIKDYDDFGYTYEVRLADGTHIEFRKTGEWKKVENRTEGVEKLWTADTVTTAILRFKVSSALMVS
ncbi:MAG: PepSY-like domain-containing protein [Tidjanibacter sp.]|nr:PepSY-like domain-containing protein [Tidjanibacter sp.]